MIKLVDIFHKNIIKNHFGSFNKTTVSLNSVFVLSIFHKISQMLLGLLSLFLISSFLTREEQGFYYTFGSLVALQSFVDLGLCIVVINAASREWSKLDLQPDGCICGDYDAKERLNALGRYVFKIFGFGSIAFLFIVGFGGYVFMGKISASYSDWKSPWVFHILFSSLSLFTMPFLAVLEGCGQIQSVTRFRIFQAIIGWLTFYIAILLQAALWAIVFLSAASAMLAAYYIFIQRRNFFKTFAKASNNSNVGLKDEILSMQWRLAVSGLFNYFIFNTITPVMFAYHGSIVAGQMGMSIQIINAAISVGGVFINAESPRFGVFIARRQVLELDCSWKKASLRSFLLMLFILLIANSIIYIFSTFRFVLVERVVPIGSFICLSIGSCSLLLGHCFVVYLRAHLVEFFMPSAIATSLLIGSLVWYFGSKNGLMGASIVYMVIHTFVSLPMAFLIWRKARRSWGY
jgi:hypothetical protein